MSWRSSLEVCDIATGRTHVVLRSERLIEAPNWHPDGWFLVNGEGRLWRADATGLTAIETGSAERCNNDHGFLPDGRIVFSAHDGTGAGMHVFGPVGLTTLPQPRPSWWHGAHGRHLAYACVRGGDRVVRIAVHDGETETVLTDWAGHHDGPDFSACGNWIWFNSDATGHAQIWRMRLDGTDAAPVFRDERVNWFPHPSPCGGHVIYLSYPPGTLGHPRDLDVSIWEMAPDGSGRRKLFDLFGGQGSINVPCWSPDGRAFAFMRYAPATDQ
ncbi:TolB family protein [Paracoccus zeaxanthinifaciens]|uniref:TolB family protein n=1 Tax=Paracoccus zeaxanthinifaciens TaxID=187400 RepID=UPI0003B6B6B9|nr:PD40 domain-containing protein [Paracoccus zeaxanthinifaciens]